MHPTVVCVLCRSACNLPRKKRRHRPTCCMRPSRSKRSGNVPECLATCSAKNVTLTCSARRASGESVARVAPRGADTDGTAPGQPGCTSTPKTQTRELSSPWRRARTHIYTASSVRSCRFGELVTPHPKKVYQTWPWSRLTFI